MEKKNKPKGKCPCCGEEGIEYSKVYGYYCGCQGLAGIEEEDHLSY